MPPNLRELFGPQGPRRRDLLAEDFEFSVGRFPSFREFVVDRNEPGMLEKPLAVTRRYILRRGLEGLQLEFVLCLGGSDAAVDLLFERASAFQRQPAADTLIDARSQLNIGETGIAWRWDEREPEGVLAFVRYNVLVFMRGRFQALEGQARELDADLSRRKVTIEYSDGEGPLLQTLTKGGTYSVARGGRLDLGSPILPDTGYFFVASGGSINRNTEDSTRYYYRAGLEKGTHTVAIYRLGSGLLADRQTIQIEIL
jgi:hypothetical protein